MPDSVATATSEPAWLYVGFWPRVLASLIDTVFQLGFFLVFYVLYWLVMGRKVPNGHDWPVNFLFMAVVLWMWIKFGATPGKMYIKAQVVDARTGQRMRLGQSVVRYLGYILSAIPFFLGYFAVAWSDKRQGWHDKLAGTVVVRPGEWTLGKDGKPELG